MKILNPAIGHDSLLAGHADGLAIDLDDAPSRHQQPDALRPMRRADPLLQFGKQRVQAVANEDVGIDKQRCGPRLEEPLGNERPGPFD